MASPYDSAIEMFNLPRFGAGPSPFSRREDPATSARRRFLEGGVPVQDEDVFIQERAAESPDPFGVMEEVENLRREREEEGFISDIAELNPGSTDYNQSLMGMIQKNPRIAQSKNALGLIDVQRRLAPEQKDYTNQFRDPLYRVSYQERVKKGLAPEAAYNETLNEAANEEMAINLIQAGVPVDRHGDLMTGGIFDRRKVAQAIASSKPRQGYDLPLSGDAKTEFESIVQDMAAARSGKAEPTDEEKLQFLPPRANTKWSEEEWAQAYQKALPLAQQRAAKEAQDRLRMFQQTYGDYYKLPQGIGVPSQSAPAASWPAEAPTTFGTPQSAPQAIPAPNVAPPQVLPRTPPAPSKANSNTGFNFPTIRDDMEASPLEAAVKETQKGMGNIVGNVKFDPLAAVAAATQPGGLAQMAAIPAPTMGQQSEQWTTAKQKVRDFISEIPGDDEQKLKVLGSLLTEQSIPHDFFSKEKAKDGKVAFIPAGSALQNAMREADPKLGLTALKDQFGAKEWKDIARVVAQEEMAKKGLINTASTAQPQGNTTTVTTRAQYDALPSGTPYVDSQGRRAVKK